METLDIPYGPDQYSALKHDFLLRQVATTPANFTQSNPTPSCNNTLNLDGGGAVSTPMWTGLGVVLGLMVALQSLID